VELNILLWKLQTTVHLNSFNSKHVWSMSGRSLTSRLLMPLSAIGVVA